MRVVILLRCVDEAKLFAKDPPSWKAKSRFRPQPLWDQSLTLSRPATHQGIEVKVSEDHLVIPYRIHHEGNEQAGRSLNEIQSIMYSCLLTRHHDGHVRQRQLERLLPVSESWVVPFVFQLTGEYVIEILNTCESNFQMLDPMLYGTFIRDNPRYFQATRDRMISYWDCYYRWQYQRRSDYVGFRIFDRFQEFASRL